MWKGLIETLDKLFSVPPLLMCKRSPEKSVKLLPKLMGEKKSTQLMSLFPAPERDYVGFGGSNGPLADKL